MKRCFYRGILIILSLILIVIFFQKKIFNNTHYNEINYVIYECTNEDLCGGWADRLKGIMSAYALALLTDRQLVINQNKPCRLVNFLEPNEINWNLNDFTTNLTKRQTEQRWSIGNNKYRLSLADFSIKQFQSKFKFISIKNNLDWLEPISRNKNIRQHLINLGFDPAKFKIQFLFKKWYNKLFKLNERLELKYKNFTKQINGTKLICVQIRIGGKREFVAYDSTFTNISNTINYWNYIKKNFIKNETNYKVFLTTDTGKIESEAIDIFGANRLITNSGNNVHLDREKKLGNQCSKVDRVYLDFHSLQNCHMALISESGFGKLGVWNRVKPNENLAMFSKKGEIIVKKSANDLFIL